MTKDSEPNGSKHSLNLEHYEKLKIVDSRYVVQVCSYNTKLFESKEPG
jgi:hypothetical protein